MIVWRKLASAKWEDAWIERLHVVPSTQLAITALPGSKSIRIEAYGLAKKEASALVKQFGGQLRLLKERSFIHPTAPSRPPIAVRGKLLIASSEKQAAVLSKKFPAKKILAIPASMAFGTGDHATTATCLRLLADISDQLQPSGWSMLDLGTGSGILALAAVQLGAQRADGFDFDPNAIRVANENARANAIPGVRFQKVDVTRWTPRRTWDVVTANLFSEVLIRSAPRIARASRPGGRLIFSGVMRHQEKESSAAIAASGFRILKTLRKGKWVTTLAVRR